jgi:hypothetical protein
MIVPTLGSATDRAFAAHQEAPMEPGRTRSTILRNRHIARPRPISNGASLAIEHRADLEAGDLTDIRANSRNQADTMPSAADMRQNIRAVEEDQATAILKREATPEDSLVDIADKKRGLLRRYHRLRYRVSLS